MQSQTAQYRSPTSVDAAIALLGACAEARVIAGGTDLLVQVRDGQPSPSTWVDVKRIPDLMQVEVRDRVLHLGAAVPAAEIFENETVRTLFPGLAEATDLIGSAQIQGRASLGGNLCNGSPAADTTPALIVLGAECVIAGPDGERAVPVSEFVEGPGRTVLQRGELLVEFRIPNPQPASADAYLRLTPRTEMDIAVVGAAVSITLDKNNVCTAARVAIGAVAPTALLVPAAADALIGGSLDDEGLTRAAAAATAAANPIDDKRGTAAYRRKVAGVLVKRAASIAAQRAQERN